MSDANSSLDPRDRDVLLDDADRAHTMFESLYQVSRIHVSQVAKRQFAWRWRVSPRGTATIIRGHAEAGAVALSGGIKHFLLVLTTEGVVEMSAGRARCEIVPNERAGLLSAGLEAGAHAPQGTRTLNIRIEPSALASHAAVLLGTPPSSPLQFQPSIDLTREPGASVLRLAYLLRDAGARPDTPLGSPHVLSHLREALLGSLLVGQPSSIHHLLNRPAPTVDARVVRKAEEIIAARATGALSIAEVAALTGVGLRSLERSFKAARGRSLRDFLKEQRLDVAHRRLRAAAPGTTVTQILYASGFGHAGEFSVAYRKRFGEAPSETLRRSIGERSLVLG